LRALIGSHDNDDDDYDLPGDWTVLHLLLNLHSIGRLIYIQNIACNIDPEFLDFDDALSSFRTQNCISPSQLMVVEPIAKLMGNTLKTNGHSAASIQS